MKKLIIVISILVIPLLILAGTSDFPRGITTASEAQKVNADVTPGEGDIYLPGTLEVDGNVRLDGSIISALDISSDLTIDGKTIFEPTAAVTVVAGTTLTITGNIMYVNMSGDITSTAVPMISTATAVNPDGTMVTLINADATDTWTINDEDTTTGSCIETIGSYPIVLAPTQGVTLMMRAGKWYAMSNMFVTASITLSGTLQAEQVTSTDDATIVGQINVGNGSFLVITEATITANDAALDIDSETQDLNIGDVAGNEWVWTDGGAMSNSGDATLTIAAGNDIACTATPEGAPWISASSTDTAAKTITFTQGIHVATAVFTSDIDVNGNVNVDGTLLVDGVISAGTLPIALTSAEGYLLSSYEAAAGTTTVTISSGTLILITGTAGAKVTMPDAATCAGRIWTIKSTGNLSGIQVVVDPEGGDTIDGSTTHTGIDAQYDFITIQSDGTNYHVIAVSTGM